MTFSKRYAQHLIAGMTSLGIVAGWGATIGTLAIATATPASACNIEPVIGSVCTFAFDWCPRGYVKADGRLLSVNQNQALFALIGYRYGGNNSSEFNVPDLRGRSVIGTGQDPLLNGNINLAQKVGQQAIMLSYSHVPLYPHTHTATFQGTGGGSQHVTVPASAGTLGVTSKLKAVQAQGTAQPKAGSLLGTGGTGSQQAPIYVEAPSTATAVELGGLEVKLTGSAGYGQIDFDVQTGITGGSVAVAPAMAPAAAPVSTQSPGLGMTACIALNGLYPDRP